MDKDKEAKEAIAREYVYSLIRESLGKTVADACSVALDDDARVREAQAKAARLIAAAPELFAACVKAALALEGVLDMDHGAIDVDVESALATCRAALKKTEQ